MPDYNLEGLSPQSFEQLIQALSTKILGNGVVVFGNGPDGGREAIFEGKVPYPSEKDNWDGYIVVQAKYLERPHNDTKKDGDWLIKQLKAELTKFVSKERKLRKPDYYILATNIRLTPVHKVGSSDKMRAVFDEFKDRVPIKGFGIWDGYQISAFLDCNEDISRKYAAWISSSDVLSEIIKRSNFGTNDFENIIFNFLQKELLASQYVKLEQAGHTAEYRTPLSRVFVDLQVSNDQSSESGQENDVNSWFVTHAVEDGNIKLDPRSLINDSQSSTSSYMKKPSSSDWRIQIMPGRYVLIGGPGQGKTTICQFISQLYRASILSDRPRHSLSQEALNALSEFINQCEGDCISIPKAKRFPINIVLNDFAMKLATTNTNRIKSVLSYIAQRIGKSTDRHVTTDDLRKWLSEYPWMIIFDGLDEVPASSNREDLLSAIRDFWVDMHESNADVLVIATTRPQGYNDDFPRNEYEYKYLLPLSSNSALNYAKRLTETRYGCDEDKKGRVFNRLKEAIKEEATVHLMKTPLQVTIMTTLVDMIGTPPRERWKLFQQYYEVICRREMERDIPAAEILRKYKPDVDAIHRQVGLLLQIECEKAGATNAMLTIDRFDNIIRNRLKEEQHDDVSIEKLSSLIRESATDRLVFLVSPEANKTGFEIRSLQEFMAAEAIMDGNDDLVQKRLRTICDLDSWRNVYLFAAGKCFADRQYLRDTIITICAENNDPVIRISANKNLLIGSKIALDILKDGAASSQPKYQNLLLIQALRFVELPPDNYCEELSNIYDPKYENIYKDRINSNLISGTVRDSSASWRTIFALSSKGIDWAQEIIKSKYIEHVQCLNEFKLPDKIDKSMKMIVCSLLLKNITKLKVKVVYDLIQEIDTTEKEDKSIIKMKVSNWAKYIIYMFTKYGNRIEVDPNRSDLSIRLHNKSSIYLRIGSINDESIKALGKIDYDGVIEPQWLPYISAARFLMNPTSNTLATELRYLSGILDKYDIDIHNEIFAVLPWPLETCINYCETSKDMLRIADMAESGELGDYEDWLKAEDRFFHYGLSIEDISLLGVLNKPLGKKIAEEGVPITNHAIVSIMHDDKNSMITTLDKLSKLYNKANNKILIRFIGYKLRWMFRTITHLNDNMIITRSCIKCIRKLLDNNEFIFAIELLDCKIDGSERRIEDEIELLDKIGKNATIEIRGSKKDELIIYLNKLCKMLTSNQNSQGLLYIIIQISIEIGYIPKLPAKYKYPNKYSEERIKVAAALYNIVVSEWNEKYINMIKIWISEYRSNSNRFINDILTIIENYQKPYEYVEKLLLLMIDEMPKNEHKIILRINNQLNILMNQKSSQLLNEPVWKELGLSTGLYKILTDGKT